MRIETASRASEWNRQDRAIRSRVPLLATAKENCFGSRKIADPDREKKAVSWSSVRGIPVAFQPSAIHLEADHVSTTRAGNPPGYRFSCS